LNDRRVVLVVDRSEETREVLQTALQRRGVATLAAAEPRRAVQLAAEHRPAVIVLDVDGDDVPPDWLAPLYQSPDGRPAHMILLGSIRRGTCTTAAGDFFAKPYHYGPLIRKIEELLE
jgi:DNA-binding response OmpR family regulator